MHGLECILVSLVLYLKPLSNFFPAPRMPVDDFTKTGDEYLAEHLPTLFGPDADHFCQYREHCRWAMKRLLQESITSDITGAYRFLLFLSVLLTSPQMTILSIGPGRPPFIRTVMSHHPPIQRSLCRTPLRLSFQMARSRSWIIRSPEVHRHRRNPRRNPTTIPKWCWKRLVVTSAFQLRKCFSDSLLQ